MLHLLQAIFIFINVFVDHIELSVDSHMLFLKIALVLFYLNYAAYFEPELLNELTMIFGTLVERFVHHID